MSEVNTNQSQGEWDPKTAQKAEIKSCLVTGGAGFVGKYLVRALLDRGCDVRAFDVAPLDFTHEKLEYMKGDLRSLDDMIKATEGVDTVFHIAAYVACLLGGRAVTEEYRKKAYDINVEGTRNVISACKKNGVKRLVYTSSNNVCFNGKPNPNMDSNTPYATRIYDLYTETKVAIEPEVLRTSGENGLLTCAIRPAGIYGPDTNYMFERFLDEIASGKLVANVGNPNAVHDNSYVENLVHGILLAAEYLVPGSPAGGKAYFIVDDEPENYFEFFRPLIEGMGYKFPMFWIPMWTLLPVLKVWEYMHFKRGWPAPMMAPKELDKVCITHFANVKDAERDFGYRPLYTVAQAMEKCVPWCKKRLDEIKAEKKK